MRLGGILMVVALAAGVRPARSRGAGELKNPETIEVRAPGGDLAIRARRGTASIPGLGEVEQVYGYDVRRGTAFPPEGAGPPAVALMPPVIAVDRGSTLRILFRNELVTPDVAGKLQPTESNLHTHGLIVSPKGSGFAGTGRDRAYGDCVFVVASTSGGDAPGQGHGHLVAGSVDQRGDPCAGGSGAGFMRAENGDIRYSYAIARDHPSGVYWFHPHPHGLSEVQVSNGLSGLMTIGSFWDYSFIKCRITASPDEAGLDACRDQEAQREELLAERRADGAGGSVKGRFLALKDIQVSRLKDRPGGPDKPRFRLIEFPLRPVPGDRPAREAFGEQADARRARCGKLVVNDSDGELSYVDGSAGPGQCWQKQRPDERWIFTVSGQVDPRITVKPGQNEVWHLANIGADVTYRLRLETLEDKPRRLAFEVRSRDGAAFPPDLRRRRPTELVLMPGARVDVLVERCSEGTVASSTDASRDCVDPSQTVHARLRTAGVATGIDADSGDKWPPVDLASVVFEAAPGAARATARWIPAPAPGPPNSGNVSPEQVGLERPPSSPAAAARVETRLPSPASGGCDSRRSQAVPADFRVDSNLVRLIRFNNRDFGEHGGELFGIHVENFRMLDPSGKAIAVANLLAEGRAERRKNQASAIASIALDEPCWQAATGEHGTAAEFAKFYPAFKMDGAPDLTATYGAREYWLLVNDSDECHNFHIHQTKFVVLDADVPAAGTRVPANQCLGDRAFVPPVNRNLLHDNYPLPPGARVLVMIRFDGPKLGRFVFHCHILEHEDKGMMATIGVVDDAAP
jgi:FtsP/CotA-like multicopper oxidase with cupredoxin domain